MQFKFFIIIWRKVYVAQFLMTQLAERTVILYASQTGNAEQIAKHLTSEAALKGIEAVCFPMDEYSKVRALRLIFSDSHDSCRLS